MDGKREKIRVDPNVGNRVLDSMDQRADLIKKSVKRIREEKIQKYIKRMIKMIVSVYGTTHRIFTIGEGKSGFVAKGLAMRLMHLGFTTYVLGESTTPGVRYGDIVIAVSGSGTTESVIAWCQTVISEEVAAKLIVITSKKESTLARIADLVIDLPGRKGIAPTGDYIERSIKRKAPRELLGDTFERNAGVFCDSIIGELFDLTKTTEAEMQERHATDKKKSTRPQ